MPRYTARSADRFVLYQNSVQSPEAEVAFIERIYQQRYGRRPAIFREDFCGTALISCVWARRRRDHVAYGVDLCRETLDWGRANNVAALRPDAARRVHLVRRNVLHVTRPKVDVVGAFNFSFFVFKTPEVLTAYFRAVRRSLRPEGLFVLDSYGGWEAQRVTQDRIRYGGFTYVWDQAEYNPINDHTTCHIHFEFPDGSRMRRAFTYHWRLWTIGGIRDCLRAAGFKHTDVYWEGTTPAGKGNGVFRRADRAENCPAWHAYTVATP
jgi:SAM-dependent methyltransferase